MTAIYLHPTVVRSPDLIERIQRITGRRAVWSHRGTHAELVEDWWRATSPAEEYLGDPTPPNAA